MPSNADGYLVGVRNNKEGQELRRLLHGVIMGITGLDKTLIRPMWQRNPPETPKPEVDWLAFGVKIKSHDTNPSRRLINGNGEVLRRGEMLEINCVSYGDNCINTLSQLRDGLEVEQNRDVLLLNGMQFIDAGDIIHAPEKIGDVWYDRADMVININRTAQVTYDIRSFTGADGEIVSSDILSKDLSIRE